MAPGTKEFSPTLGSHDGITSFCCGTLSRQFEFFASSFADGRTWLPVYGQSAVPFQPFSVLLPPLLERRLLLWEACPLVVAWAVSSVSLTVMEYTAFCGRATGSPLSYAVSNLLKKVNVSGGLNCPGTILSTEVRLGRPAHVLLTSRSLFSLTPRSLPLLETRMLETDFHFFKTKDSRHGTDVGAHVWTVGTVV